MGELKTKETPKEKKQREAEEKNILSQLKLDDNDPELPELTEEDIAGMFGVPPPKPPPGKARAPRLVRRSARTLDTDAYAVALKM